MKKYIVIAGVNGEGKSILYQIDDNLQKILEDLLFAEMEN